MQERISLLTEVLTTSGLHTRGTIEKFELVFIKENHSIILISIYI